MTAEDQKLKSTPHRLSQESERRLEKEPEDPEKRSEELNARLAEA